MADGKIKLFGKQHALKRIKEMYSAGRFPHSVMLTGADGTGKRELARWCAALMLCENPQNNEPCFNCRNCRNTVSGDHADIIYAKGEKYTADSVRENVQLASYLPNDGNIRVFIFEDCDSMNPTCQNILLKSIEEPAKHNRYIFTCESTSAVLSTILSRVVSVSVGEMSAEECEECLVYGGMDSAEAKNAVIKLGTNPGKIKAIMNDKKRLALYDSAEVITNALASIDEYKAAAEFAKYTDRQELFTLTAILYDKVSASVKPGVQPDESIRRLVDGVSLKKRYRLSEKLSMFLLQSEYNINAKLFSANITAQLFEILF